MRTMIVNEIMQSRSITKYRLSKNSGVPYTTVNDICTGKAQLEKCSAETIYRIAKALEVSMESLLEPCFVKRSSFELFKSNVCHRLKELGDVGFIIETLESDSIRDYYNRGWYPESLYLLAMLDYISRLNDVPVCTEYNDLRRVCLQDAVYPASVITASIVAGSESPKEQARASAIPEFIRFNIVESEVRNIV